MKQVYISGGPGLDEYLSLYFSESHSDQIFYAQSRASKDVDSALLNLQQLIKSETNVCVVAHSWGGVLALEWIARRMQPSISALVLMSAPVSHHSLEAFVAECQKREINMQNREEIFLSLQEQRDPECVNQLDKILCNFTQESVEQAMPHMQVFDQNKLLQEIQIPTLVIYGEDDVRVPSHLQKSYGQGNSLVEHLCVAGAGHFPFFRKDDLATVRSSIQDFYFSKAKKKPAPL